MSPEVGSTIPSNIRMVVVLPAPLVRAIRTPLPPTCRRSSALTTFVSPYCLVSRRVRIVGAAHAYLRPKRRKTHARAARVSRIRPIPTRPPNADGLTVLLTSIDASASSEEARKVIW